MTVTVNISFYYADGQSLEKYFSDMIDIGVFNADPDDFSTNNTVIYLEKRLIKTGENIIHLVVKKKSQFIGIDPFVKLIDRDSADNIYRL